MCTIYLAGPLFTLAEREFNSKLAEFIRKKRNDLFLLLPQETAVKFKNDKNKNKEIFRDCIDSINKADIIVALLDGADADSGTCVELGYAFCKGMAILGIRTDFRISEEKGLNLMLPFSCTELYLDTSATIETIADKIIGFTDSHMNCPSHD